MEKKGFALYFSIIFLNFLNYSTYGLPITYFPNVAKTRGVLDFVIGLIFSTYPVFSFIFGFLINKRMSKWGRKRIIQTSQITLSLATLVFGITYLLPQNSLFIIGALIGRSLQGVAIGSYATSSLSYIPDFWPDEIDKRIVIVQVFLTLGIGVGPIFGSLIYEYCGYLYVFIIPSIIIFFFGMMFSCFVLPNDQIKENGEENSELVNKGRPLGILKSLFIKDVVYLLLATSLVCTSFAIVIPEFENKVIDLGYSPKTASILLSFQTLAYILTCLIMFFTVINNRKSLYFISLMLNCVGLCCWGLDAVVSIENHTIAMLLGLGYFLNGIICALCILPFVSECIAYLKEKFPQNDRRSFNAMASGIFNGSMAIAEFLGPILGGILCDLFDFSRCTLIFCVFAFIFMLLFCFHGEGGKAMLKAWAKNEKLDNKGLLELDELKI